MPMNSCPECCGFSERLNLGTPREYLDIVRQLIEIVQQGTFLLVRADCSLHELPGQTWPGDILIHEFECFACGRSFELSADTYHGHAHWTPGELPVTQSNLPKPN